MPKSEATHRTQKKEAGLGTEPGWSGYSDEVTVAPAQG